MPEITLESKRRLEFNIYSYQKGFERLQKAIKDEDDQGIYTNIGELLLWIITTEKWHCEYREDSYNSSKDRSGDGRLLFGLICAYNSMKHNMVFQKIHSKQGSLTLPVTLPFTMVTTVCWREAGEDLKGIFPNQIVNYIKYIEGKEVLRTFERAINFLNQENSKVLSNN